MNANATVIENLKTLANALENNHYVSSEAVTVDLKAAIASALETNASTTGAVVPHTREFVVFGGAPGESTLAFDPAEVVALDFSVSGSLRVSLRSGIHIYACAVAIEEVAAKLGITLRKIKNLDIPLGRDFAPRQGSDD